MARPALRLYEEGLREHGGLRLQMSDGSESTLALERFLGAADTVDETLLRGVRGPVLDLGCGPGRHLHALARRGVFGLGVDLSPVAVALARNRGVPAIVASVFGELPGAGDWRLALLLDGNIGIGGDPGRLLRRVRALLSCDGEVLVELDPPGTPSGPIRARLVSRADRSADFAWCRVAFDAVDELALESGFRVADRLADGGRWFARLARSGIILR